MALDLPPLPYGSCIIEASCSGVNGRHIDIYFDTHDEAAAYGLQQKEVYLVP